MTARGPLREEPRLPFQERQLENGLRIFVHEDRSLPRVSLNLWYHVGSASERPGRTGLAHLFEHIMFEGSAHVPRGSFDTILEGLGGTNNGSTSQDRTNYWINLPSQALNTALWLEADRMGWLLETLDSAKLDLQRSVVQNERRQTVDNRPYGRAWEEIQKVLYPAGHPYSWPIIGWMEDLEAVELSDLVTFFRRHYHPRNATLAMAGDVDTERAFDEVAAWFGEIPGGEPPPKAELPPMPQRAEWGRAQMEDAVQLARLYLVWPSPSAFAPGDSALELAGSALGQGRSSRLYRTLVQESGIAQDVWAGQSGGGLGGTFEIIVTAVADRGLEELERRVLAEVEALATAGPTATELERGLNRVDTALIHALETVGGFGGRADRLNEYFFHTGDAGYLPRDLERYRQLTAPEIAREVEATLLARPGVALQVLPAAEGGRR